MEPHDEISCIVWGQLKRWCVRKWFPLIAGVTIIVVGIVYHSARQPSGRPSAKIQFVDYGTDRDSVVATIVLTNTGMSALTYVAGFGGTFYSVSATTQGGATNYDSWVRTTMDTVVWPAASVRIRVYLPPATRTWNCTVPVRGASSRLRVYTHLAEWGIWNRAGKLSSAFIQMFPLDDSDYIDVKSDTFEVSTNVLR